MGGLSRSSTAAFHLFALASGALALVYEVLWMRRFAVLFGATAPAVAATLSAFFLGLAAGSAVLGNRAARWARPLRAYGVLEAGIAAGALLSEQVLGLCDLHYRSFYALLSDSPAVFLPTKTALAMAALFVPTFLMGGTLPTLAQAAAGDLGRLGVRAGGLYAVNTLGATLGALAVPFALLPGLGADRSYLAAIAGSLAVGGSAWLLDAGPPARGRHAGRDSGRNPVAARDSRLAWTLAILAFLSGFLLLGLEVLWTRMFAMVHENSIYSFSAVLAVFLVGLAGGAALAREFLRRGYPARAGLAAAWLTSGILVLLSPRLFVSLSSGMDYFVEGAGAALDGFRILRISVPIMLPALLISGAILPLLMELAGAEAATPAGPAVGRLMAANTLGSIVGPLLAGSVLASGTGLWWSIALVGLAMLITGDLIRLGLSPRARTASRRFAACVLLVLGVLLLGPAGLPRVRINPGAGEKLVCVKEGLHGTVAVLEDRDHRWITLNNHYVLGGTASATEERQQAHLPLLLHPAARKVAFLGLGTGITAGATLLHAVDSVVALEIVPAVIHAAMDHFGDANHNLAADPRVEIHAEDARNFLKGSSRRFDVIIGDLAVPWRPGESSLFSEEHFRATRAALLPGGVFCQWLPLFQLSEEGFRTIAATFLDVYPSAMLWRGDFLAGEPAVALIGQRDAAPLDIAAIDRQVRELAPRLAETNPGLTDPAGLWLFLIGPLDARDPRYARARRNRDSRPWLELAAPAAHLLRSPKRDPLGHGRFEAALFEEMRRTPLQGSPLERLDADHRRWRDAGAALWNASVLAAAGKEKEAAARALEIFATLPLRLQIAVMGRDLRGPAVSGRPAPRE